MNFDLDRYYSDADYAEEVDKYSEPTFYLVNKHTREIVFKDTDYELVKRHISTLRLLAVKEIKDGLKKLGVKRPLRTAHEIVKAQPLHLQIEIEFLPGVPVMDTVVVSA